MKIKKLKNLKITSKLAISASVFLLPLGIMLFSNINMSVSSIRKNQIELNGVEVLRPALALMQILPQYVRFTVDSAHGDLEFTKEYTSRLLDELNEKYDRYFSNRGYVVSPQTLNENLDHLEGTRIRDTVIWAYRQLMQDLFKIVVYTGDISGLVTDSDIECAYLIAATIHELPQAQDRMVIIGNLLRSIEDGAFTQRRRAELQLNIDLLIYSDSMRIQNRFNSASNLGIRNSESLELFEQLLRTCYDRLTYFAAAVDEVISEPVVNTNHLYTLYEISGNANNAIHRLQTASLDRLEKLITDRINSDLLRLIVSLAAAVLATLFAFGIIFITAFSLRKTTVNMGKIFGQLEKNDLTVNINELSGDELGEFMSALNGFIKKLKIDFLSFGKNTSMVTTAVQELSSSAKEITVTANDQSASVAEIVSTMENNKDLSSQASEKTKEVAELAIQTQDLSRRGAELREINEEMMLDIIKQNAKIIDIIRNLADMLSRIYESIKIIDTIADHTKLIAFNAALEASSSGEAGSRFSVVASEIRRFADNVVESASEIKEKIAELQEASQTLLTEANNGTQTINIGYNRMVEQKEVFKNIVDVSQNVANRSQQISNLSKQQEYAIAQVFMALKEISLGVNQFVSATGNTSATLEKLNNMSSELKDTLDKYHVSDRNII